MWLQVWEGTGDGPFFLLNVSKLSEYPALGAHGTSLLVDSSYSFGSEFIPSRLHYLSSDKILALGPGWDVAGRRDAFLCDSSGNLVRKSILQSLNSGVSVSDKRLLFGQWEYSQSFDAFSGALSEAESFPDGRLVRCHRLLESGAYVYSWDFDPKSLLFSGAGLSILKPVNSKSSGRNDRRWTVS